MEWYSNRLIDLRNNLANRFDGDIKIGHIDLGLAYVITEIFLRAVQYKCIRKIPRVSLRRERVSHWPVDKTALS